MDKNMKTILTIILLIVVNTSLFSQQKGLPPEGDFLLAGTSKISKNDKWIGNFTINKKIYRVYCGYQTPNPDLQQKENDTLAVYKIAPDKSKYSELEITKLATRNGKIIGEEFYKVEHDTLTIVANSYDYIGTFKSTSKYVTDKYGLKMISQKTENINTDTLSDKYLKPAEMNVIFPAK